MATSTKLKAVPAAPTTGALCDERWQLREDKRVLEAQVKVIDAKLEENEEALIKMLEAQGLDAAKGKKGSVSLGSPSVHFSFDDDNNGFDSFAKYVKKTGFFHLFFRRVSDAGCREIFEKTGAIPGLKHYTKRKLNLKTVS